MQSRVLPPAVHLVTHRASTPLNLKHPVSSYSACLVGKSGVKEKRTTEYIPCDRYSAISFIRHPVGRTLPPPRPCQAHLVSEGWFYGPKAALYSVITKLHAVRFSPLLPNFHHYAASILALSHLKL